MISTARIIEADILPVLPSHLGKIVQSLVLSSFYQITEIRLRINQPLFIVIGSQDVMLTADGKITSNYRNAYVCTKNDIDQIVQLISKHSLYAFEQEIQQGYITIRGGHRVGLAGQVAIEDGKIKIIKKIYFLNIRIARQIKGCADGIIPYIYKESRQVASILIISPPRCGKTTFLRDLARQISSGQLGYEGQQVGIVDERSEIAACQNGIPTVDVGPRTDVMDACPKACGMLMLIRSMAPQVLITDELGRLEDSLAVKEALHAGVSVIATIHGSCVKDITNRPFIGELIDQKYFDRYVLLGNRPNAGTIIGVINSASGEELYRQGKGVEQCC